MLDAREHEHGVAGDDLEMLGGVLVGESDGVIHGVGHENRRVVLQRRGKDLAPGDGLELVIYRVGNGLQPLGVAGEKLTTLISDMRSAAEDAGRNPDDLELSLGHLVTKVDSDRAGRLAEAGADRVVLAMPAVADLQEAKDQLSACAQRLGLTS